MAVFRADFDGTGVTLATGTLAGLAKGRGPVVVLVHGFKYTPDAGCHCPHSSLYAPLARPSDPKLTSWAHHLHAGLAGQPDVLGFGWPGRGALRDVYYRAEAAGQARAETVARARRVAPHRPVVALGHSLGARVILAAMAQQSRPVFDRVALLAPAEFTATANAALAAPGAVDTGVLCVTSRENDLFDAMLECALPRHGLRDKSCGIAGLDGPEVATFQIDDPNSLRAMHRIGYRIAPSVRRVCHWSVYLRPGLFPLYRAVLFGPVHPRELRAALPRHRPPRWSRFRLAWSLPSVPGAPVGPASRPG